MRESALADLIAPNATHACLLAGATGKPACASISWRLFPDQGGGGVLGLEEEPEADAMHMAQQCIWT